MRHVSRATVLVLLSAASTSAFVTTGTHMPVAWCLFIQSALDNRTERAGGLRVTPPYERSAKCNGLRAGAPSLRQVCPTARGVRALRAQFQLPNFNFGGGGGGESSQQAGNAAMKQQLLDMCAAARQGIDGEWLWPAWPSKCGAQHNLIRNRVRLGFGPVGGV